MKCRSLVLISLIIISLSLASCSGTAPLSSENEMTAFNIVNVSPPATGVINQSTYSIIAITVPYDTDVTHLIATFTVSAGATVYVNHNYSTVQQSGITTNDFTNPVVYTVWSADNHLRDYRVTVTVAYGLPKTGQTTSYAIGDDGYLKKGVAWPSTRFTDNSDGTITDNLTGLVWLKNTSCFGQDTWANALTDANKLNSGECGLTDGSNEGDWRLPNREELKSLIDYGQINTAIWLNGLGFSNLSENDGSGWYWSSTTCAAALGYAWIMNMPDGRWTNVAKTNNFYYVWAVRSGPAGVVNLPKTGQTTSYATGDDGDLKKGVAWPTTRFTDNNNGTMTDNLTGLVWLKNASCIGQPTWANALTGANTLNDGECGLTDGSIEGDWRLPNANELESLINFQQSNPATWLNAQGFTGVQGTWHMVSTTNAANTSTYAWTIMMGNGNMDNLKIKANAADYAWPVRDAK